MSNYDAFSFFIQHANDCHALPAVRRWLGEKPHQKGQAEHTHQGDDLVPWGSRDGPRGCRGLDVSIGSTWAKHGEAFGHSKNV